MYFWCFLPDKNNTLTLHFKNDYLKVYKKIYNNIEELVHGIDSYTLKCYTKVIFYHLQLFEKWFIDL